MCRNPFELDGLHMGEAAIEYPHAHYKAQEQHRALYGPTTPMGTAPSTSGAQGDSYSSPPPVLVPQEELRECGRRRIREVDAAGVRDALRILDAQFGRR